MAKTIVYDVEGKEVGEIEIDDSLLVEEVNTDVVYSAITWQMARRRKGTASTKTRSEVRGGGRKPWRQKGTGRARQGSIRSPLWPGGGVTFGPKPRKYSYSLPKKVRRLALRSALTAKIDAGEMIVIDELRVEIPQTKWMVNVLKNLSAGDKPLIVTSEKDENITKCARNIKGIKVIRWDGLSVYDIVRHPKVIIVQEALEKIMKRLSDQLKI